MPEFSIHFKVARLQSEVGTKYLFLFTNVLIENVPNFSLKCLGLYFVGPKNPTKLPSNLPQKFPAKKKSPTSFCRSTWRTFRGKLLKCPEASPGRIPCKILQCLYGKTPWRIPADGPNTVSESTVSNTELSELFGPHWVPGREFSEFLSAFFCLPKRTHRVVFCRAQRVCLWTQWVLSSETVLSKQYSASFPHFCRGARSTNPSRCRNSWRFRVRFEKSLAIEVAMPHCAQHPSLPKQFQSDLHPWRMDLNYYRYIGRCFAPPSCW